MRVNKKAEVIRDKIMTYAWEDLLVKVHYVKLKNDGKMVILKRMKKMKTEK